MRKIYKQPVAREIQLEMEDMIAGSIVKQQEQIGSQVSNDRTGSVWEDSSESIWGN